MITDAELKTHFGSGHRFEHCVNLRDRMECNGRHLQTSIDWAEEELVGVVNLVAELREVGSGIADDIRHFSRQAEILRELIKEPSNR